ncbi:MAG: flagellar biosynthesis protein FlhB [Micropepsaceae bacterium]
MAEDNDDSQKTEQPSQQRLQEAENKGDVTQSPDIAAWLVLAAATAYITLWSPLTASSLRQTLASYIAGAHTIHLTSQSAGGFASSLGWELMKILSAPFAILVVVAVGSHLIQHRPVFSLEKIKPDGSRLNLMKGMARLFGRAALVNFAKGILKTVAVAAAITMTLWPARDKMLALIAMPVSQQLPQVVSLLSQAMIAALAVLGVIAIADYAWQYFERMRRLKMTRQEMKEEARQSEGDPIVKQRLRQIRSERSRRRMMAAVPKAAVIITNPTHYAVALAYETGKMGAPICVAKGMDDIALKIREIGKQHNVPIIENPPLARTLYASVDVDETIKPEHYKAVAQVIGFVMRLKGKVASAKR